MGTTVQSTIQVEPEILAEKYFDLDFLEVFQVIHEKYIKDITNPDISDKFKSAINQVFIDAANMMTHAKVVGLMLMED